MIRVVLTGAAGKMGKEAIKAIAAAEDIELVGAVSPGHAGLDAGTVAGLAPLGLKIGADLAETLAATQPHVMLDFTTPEVVRRMADTALAHGVRALIGTTGLTAKDQEELRDTANLKGLGVLIAPNFAIGALLLMQFAAKAAEYFDHAEIIELHHNQKLDAPSGTALKTAEAMLAVTGAFGGTNAKETVKLEGARGGDMGGIHIHSVRLPGLLAHQEVIFGGKGQVLTLRHDAMSRECYMPGVLVGIRRVMEINGLVYGLENVL